MRLRNYITALSAVAALTGCGDFLEEYSQDKDYVSTWNDLNELLIGDCYMPINESDQIHYFSNYGMTLHLFSDEVEEQVAANGSSYLGYNNHSYMFGYMTWQPRVGVDEDFSTYRTENATWTAIYKYINVANNILASAEELPRVTASDTDGYNYVKGQAHFLRGFYYFWLTNLYGQPYAPETAATQLGVPLKTTKEVKDIKFERNTVKECYDLILSDLLAAEQELTATSSISRKSIYRADSVSVRLLLSRVYLYMQNWEKAAEYAQKVIDEHPSLQDLNTDKSAFASTDNPETIFSMGGDDFPDFQYYGAQSLRMSNSLYNSYGSNDLRKSLWFWTYASFHGLTKVAASESVYSSTVSDPGYYNLAYNLRTYRYISSLFWLRSGEAYLNLAEAEAYLGNESEALAAVNKLRAARYYSTAADKNLTSTGSQLITDIRNERKRELAGEGARWFDLRRYRVCQVQPEKISITHTFTIYVDENSSVPVETRQYVLTEDDASWTSPIPQEVINFNTGMQNNGNEARGYTLVSIPN